MAFEDDQIDSPLPANGMTDRTSVDFLPRYFRTSSNRKFLNATLDQMISEGEVEKISAFLGRKDTEAYKIGDRYLNDVSPERSFYQLEPALTIKDNLDNYVFVRDYNDYINQLRFFNSSETDHSKINSQEFYAWNPHIDFDKFINYREYYWLPTGPQSIPFLGQSTEILSTYKINLVDDGDNKAYVFSPDGLTRNPTLRLYRGQTYRFEVNCPGQPIAFKLNRISGDSFFYTEGISTGNTYVEKGVIEFTVSETAPNIIYYISKNDINTSGIFNVFNIDESTQVDVEKDVIGKKTYTMSNGVELSNGMKIFFQGLVTPEKYKVGNWYVEGVGDGIKLIPENELTTPANYTTNENVEFDNEKFDTQGFETNSNFPREKDYITINRSSKDRNPWSRYNRWFHREVIEISALTNNQPIDLDQTARAVRPIIEFEPDLLLWNFGKQSKKPVDLIDTFTKDVFSTIEGSIGYNVDGVDLVEGQRVLFAADTDIRVSGRIFKVDFITHLGTKRITLLPEVDTDPQEDETVLVLNGLVNSGKVFSYKNSSWSVSQEKLSINQPPLFDVVDSSGISYGDRFIYTGTNFSGTKLFSYATGTVIDQELNLPIKYRNIGNIGDIVFDFNLHSDSFTYQDLATSRTLNLDRGYLVKSNGLEFSQHVNGWIKANENSVQPVVRQYDAAERQNFFPIDMYDNSNLINDFDLKVFVNGKFKSPVTDYSIFKDNNFSYVNFTEDLKATDSVVIKSRSNSLKNDNGFYEIPKNLESNPLNQSMTDFTLGEISNHLKTIVENNSDVIGSIPGPTNLRDLSNLSTFGRKIIQNSAPLSIAAYHLTDKRFNIIKALRFAKEEYSKFKRNFLRTAESYGFDGDTRIHLDLLLKEMTQDKIKSMPFYFSDMVPFLGNTIYQQEVIDDSITEYPIIFDFNLSSLSEKAVLVYLNDQQLLHKKDYIFINDNFIRILSPLVEGDDLKIVQYENTDGCYIPPTPTKLGLFPLYEPSIFIDDTYLTPTKVIQGHDGSITVAFDDYRDDLILEFEKRIYNNIKIQYDTNLLDINDFISGYFRKTDLSLENLNNVLRQEFLKWSRFISEDYTKHTFFDRNNTFTFNYKNFAAPDDSKLLGFWRAIYRYFYDTDRPHTHPWEILGFSIEPQWWKTVYGPAPYTSDNLVLWNDIAEGIIREPGKYPDRNEKYARPTILNHLPVDETGSLRSPLDSNLVRDFVSVFAEGEFTFGDQAPIESAWRKNSEYPFALITALTLLRPARIFATAFDRVRQVRDDTGQIVYKMPNGNLRFNTENLVFPNTIEDNVRSFTSGLVNYICDYTLNSSQDFCDEYKNNIKSIKVNLTCKLGGFTTKEKFRLMLDSRNPLNQNSVFIPEENYEIILNSSTPISSIDYSGVIVEKQATGFIVRGYNQATPEFKYYKPLETVSDPIVNIGGISESFLEWDTDKFYNKTQIVRFDNNFYRVTTSHTSSGTFELKYFAKLPKLPVVGGRDVIFRKRFDDELSSLHYGAELATVQDVVDFLLGHDRYLIEQGFNFEYFNPSLETVTNWQTSVREFVFWTTQNWAAGSVIALSPGADEINFSRDFSVVDDIYDNFYEYSVYKQDGNLLEPLFTNSVRKNNNFTLKPKDTADGIYHVTLNLVQKEHILVLDNKSVFNDIIYDQTQGYRQDRIKVVGYRTSGWQGDFNIPGFIYDRAQVSEWKSWKDYALGETIKYKEFYYSARKNVPGSEQFSDENWYRLPSKPTSKLIPNWDYRANQFPDFYDLDTDSFDVEQQKLAQHLIGYQNRQYLENIINDDVAQYKFYQGMIREKGTSNSLLKLFDTLSAADKESIEFFEEWALRVGQYGAVDAFQEVEFKIDEAKVLINPQPFELVSSLDNNLNDFVYRITPDETYVKPDGYDHNPFPTTAITENFVNTAGFVNADDVDYIIFSKTELSNYSLNQVQEGTTFWLGYDKNSWNVLRFTKFANEFKTVEFLDPGVKITLASNRDNDIIVGDYIGIATGNSRLTGIFLITAVDFNSITVEPNPLFTDDDATLINFDGTAILYKFLSVRKTNIDELNDLGFSKKIPGDLVWFDGADNQWSVWKYDNVYTFDTITDEADNFANNIAVSDNDRIMAVAADDRVLYFVRESTKQKLSFRGQIAPVTAQGLTDTNESFGRSLSLSSDGQYLLIGAPDADRVSGDSSNSLAEGYVAIYKKNAADVFQLNEIRDEDDNIIFDGVFRSSNREQFQYFGSNVVIKNQLVLITSKGSATVSPSICLFSINGNLINEYIFAGQDEITDISVSDTNVVLVSRTDETVTVLTFDQTGFTFSQILSIEQLEDSTDLNVQAGIDFARSAAISRDGNTIAVGAPKYSFSTITEQGIVVIYEKDENYIPAYTISNPSKQEGSQFGARVFFNKNDDQLITYLKFGNRLSKTIFDNDITRFDFGSTSFNELDQFSGAVFVFDKYQNRFIFAEELFTDSLGTQYGSGLFVTNKIYVGDPTQAAGAIYEFQSDKKTWSIHRSPAPAVDSKKIKSIFLYDTEKNSVVSYLDFVDPLQGKILGLAEQELAYKTFYDPATYTIGTSAVVVDSLGSWNGSQVGKLWWDLSDTKFLDYYQGSVVFKSNTWNRTFGDAEIAVYEWVESNLKPSEWDELADTEEGLTLGISGKSKYGDLAYSIDQTYDTLIENYSNTYYFWVRNKVTVPNVEFRKYSAKDVADFITDPKAKGIRYVTMLGSNQWALVNCKDLITDKKIAINFRYWLVDNKEINLHSHYQLLTDGDTGKKLNPYIEQKWFDSLIGEDRFGNAVPDIDLPLKLRYGILNKPRQGMFVNRIEAVKQFVERVNSSLIKKNLVDDFDLTRLDDRETPPGIFSREYDVIVETYSQLRFIGTANLRTARLEPVVVNGKIVRINILDAGLGYIDISHDISNIVRKGPSLSIDGTGSGAKLSLEINSLGEVINAVVEKQGKNYSANTVITVRPFTVLVNSDETANGVWSLYVWNSTSRTWVRDKTQTYDVTKYWSNADWYLEGFNKFVKVDYIIDFAYELPSTKASIGDLIKIRNQGASGWILLEKIDDQDTLETTVNYRVVGRENGTIQLNDNIFRFSNNNVGYDGPIYDSDVFDDQPKEEFRIILDVLKNNIFVDELEVEYNQLFFSSLRYIFSEQIFVDWAFKTSFVRGKHNVGELKQKTTFQSDNIDSFEDYIKEVKPYRSKIREFVSSYSKIESTRSLTTDFDLPPTYDFETDKIVPIETVIENGNLLVDIDQVLKPPYDNWYYNIGFSLKSIEIVDGGTNYFSAPLVLIQGISAVPATATAYISQGRLSKIVVDNPGAGYLTTPTIILDGGQDDGIPAKLAIELERGPVRSNTIGIKFDRINPRYTITEDTVIENFTGSGSRTRFDLKWPIDLRLTKVTIFVDNSQLLDSEYVIDNIKDKTSSYTRYFGRITFDVAPPVGSNISIAYNKNISLMDAADRIQFFYTDPQPGQLGQDLSQLMQGVDYGGVFVKSIGFNIGVGWDALPWNISGWDSFDENYTDQLFRLDGTTRDFILGFVPEDGEEINVYLNNVRIDDPNYDSVTAAEEILLNLISEKNTLLEELVPLQSTLEFLEVQLEIAEEIQLDAQQQTAQALNDYNQAILDFGGGSPEAIAAESAYLAALAEEETANNNAASATNAVISAQAAVNAKQLEITNKQTEIDSAQAVLDSLDPIVNENAEMNTLYGDGSTSEFSIPGNVDLIADDEVIFRKATSDGSFDFEENTVDIDLSGGDLAYNSVKGILPEEINIDGDGFITSMTSPAPEEMVTGQVIDTVDIQVFHKVSDGAPTISSKHYIANNRTEFLIGQRPGTKNSVIVKINGLVKRLNVDYVVDFINEKVVLTSVPDQFDEITIISLSQNGLGILDLDFFIGDGETTEFVTAARWNGDFSAFVTVDGVVTPVAAFVADESYVREGNIAIRFSQAPKTDSVINYTIINSIVPSISNVAQEILVYDESSSSYELSNIPLFVKPLENHVIVEIDGHILRSVDTLYFTVAGNNRTYQVDPTDYPFNSIDPNELKVYKNGIELQQAKDWSWISSSNQLKIKQGVAISGDVISLAILVNAQYLMETVGSTVRIRLLESYVDGTTISVTTFSNHDLLDIKRSNDIVVTDFSSSTGVNYQRFKNLAARKIQLEETTSNPQYIWLILNNELLTPNVDYILEEDLKTISIKVDINFEDILEVMSFGSKTITQPFGYRIFKDMLNSVIYKRYDDSTTTVLLEPLRYYDPRITVENAAGLTEPNASLNQPGIIFIEGERIEYLKKTGNVLSQLRRGTLGTGIADIYEIGSKVRDQSQGHTVPYNDRTATSRVFTGGSSQIIPIDFIPMKDHISNGGIYKTAADWIEQGFSTSFSPTSIQADDIEVFVGGRRLRKAPSMIWSESMGPDSPSGDILLDAEFVVDGETASVQLADGVIPVDEQGNQLRVTIVVQKKTGNLWTEIGQSLSDSQSNPAKFIRAKSINLRE